MRRAVYAKARSVNHEQFPAVYDQVLGDFYFMPANTPPSASVANVVNAQVATAPSPAPSTAFGVIPAVAQVISPPTAPAAIAVPTPPGPVASFSPPPATPFPFSPVSSPPFSPPHQPAAQVVTLPGSVSGGRPVLHFAALGLPTRRSFWNKATRDDYTPQLRTALGQAGGALLGMHVEDLEMGQDAFDAWWSEPAEAPRSRALCGAQPAPRALLSARVETPPVFFTTTESAYWPELKLRLVDCANQRIYRQEKSLVPDNQDAWPFATEFKQEVERFLRDHRADLSN